VLAPYRRVLAVPHVPLLVLASLAARLPFGVSGVAIVLFLEERTGSFAAGGAVSAAYGLSVALTGPVLGRLVDRFGQTRVLVPTAAGAGTASLLLVALGLADAPVAVLAAVGAAAGASQPPISPALRGVLADVLGPQPGLLRSALALDAIVLEGVFILGPLLTAALVAFASPQAALVTATLAAVVGTLAFAASPPSRRWRGAPRTGAGVLGPLRSPGVRTLVAAAMSFGVAFGASEVALPAFGLAEGSASLGPTVFAALAVGSVVGGLVYGAAAPRDLVPLYLAAAAGVPLGLLALCLADSAPAMLLLAPLAGVMLAPLTAAENELAGRLAPPGAVTEAYAWVITATVLGFSLGTGLAGVIVDAADWRTALAAGCGVGLLGTAGAFARRRTLQPA
jgi:MFS family permease